MFQKKSLSLSTKQIVVLFDYQENVISKDRLSLDRKFKITSLRKDVFAFVNERIDEKTSLNRFSFVLARKQVLDDDSRPISVNFDLFSSI